VGIVARRISTHAVFVAHAGPSPVQSEEVGRRNFFLPTREDRVWRFTPVVLAPCRAIFAFSFSPGLAFGIVRTGRFFLLFFATLKLPRYRN